MKGGPALMYLAWWRVFSPAAPWRAAKMAPPVPPSPSVLRPFRPFSWTLCWRISRIVLTSIPLFLDHIQTLWTVWSFNHEILHHICAIGKLLELDCIIFVSVLRSISRLASKLSTQVMKSCLTVCLYSLISSSLQSFYSVGKRPLTNKHSTDLNKH